MGCNFSSETVKVLEVADTVKNSSAEAAATNSDKRSSVTKSHDSVVSSNDSIESDKLTVYSGGSGSDILSPHRSKSVDFNRNSSAARDDPPVATATIIRNVAANSTPMPNRRKAIDTEIIQQHDDITTTQADGVALQKALTKRRSSDGDVGKVTSVTCIPRSLIKSNPLLNSNFQEVKTRPPVFGSRNSRLIVTQSQTDFFRMLDEKVAQGKDYSSEDEKSLISFRAATINRKDSCESTGYNITSLPQQVR